MAKTILVFLFCLLISYQSLAAAVETRQSSPPETANASADAKESAAQQDADKNKTDTALAPVDSAWEKLWSGQQEMIREIRDKATSLSKNFSIQTENLSAALKPFDEEGRRLLVFVNTFKGYPQPLEAIIWRISATINDLNKVLEPLNQARSEAETLLERLNHMAVSIPDVSDRSKLSPEMAEYANGILRARMRLTAVLSQYASLLPSLQLATNLEETRKSLEEELPMLWQNYYLQKPIPWLNPESWARLPFQLSYSWQIIIMRLPVEIPVTWALWGAALLRFLIGIVFGAAITVILAKKWLKKDSSPAMRHIFEKCAPWLVFGSSLLGSAMAAGGELFRLFLALGSGCLIFGEILLAWNLRLIQYPETPDRRAPFLRMLPLAGFAYLLLYLPLPHTLVLLFWTIILVYYLASHKLWRTFRQPKMQLETAIRECAPLILWPCLFLAVSGLQIYSMLLYLSFVSLSVACELGLGGMMIAGRINELLPEEGARAVVARLGIALAAPFVLVLAVAGVCLWILILPGGTYLLSEYVLKGVSVGATQFNVAQLLLIISAFYLTRTVVSMGTHFLTKLPSHGSYLDATLITPMQTALTYIAWAAFALFALNSMGVSLSNLAMVAGGLSVGIGFGMQTIVNNFLSGLILIFGRTLQVGDVVEVGGTTGRVRKISVRATMVETYDNAIIYVPNSEFMAGRLTNWTSFTRSVRCQIQVGVAYGSDTQKVINLLINIAKDHPNVLKFPVPAVIFADFAASSLDFRLRFWVKDFELGAITSSDLRLKIDEVFAENNIEIAFPQLDVHLKKDQEKTASISKKENIRLMTRRLSRPKSARKPVRAINMAKET